MILADVYLAMTGGQGALALGEVRAMIAGVHDVAIDPSKPAELSDIATTMKHLRELTRITEIEINRVVLDCTRARRQMIGSASNSGPTRH